MSEEFLNSLGGLVSEFVALMENNFSHDNEEYKSVYQKELEILDTYENLRTVWDEKTAIDLSKEEIEALIRLNLLFDERARMFSVYMFLQGVKFSHYLFK